MEETIRYVGLNMMSKNIQRKNSHENILTKTTETIEVQFKRFSPQKQAIGFHPN